MLDIVLLNKITIVQLKLISKISRAPTSADISFCQYMRCEYPVAAVVG